MSVPAVSTIDPQVITAGPLVLPSQRRLMILLMLALAALLQVATSGWGPIENGPDGMNAAIARELALGIPKSEISQLWHVPIEASLGQVLTAQSFRIFNVSELAARLPFAMANLLVVLLVFWIAERLGGFWRGLVSGIIAATMSGTILHGRDGGGGALTALFFTLSIYLAVRMLEQRSQWRWHFFYWGSLGLLLAVRAPTAAIVSLLGVWTAYVFFREAKIRLRTGWWIAGSVLFIGVLVIVFHYHPLPTPRWQWTSLTKYFWTLFPWSVVMVPPCLLRFRKILRIHEWVPAEAVLWTLFILGTFWVVLIPKDEEWPTNVACMTPVFALLGSIIWERTSSRIRMVGVALLVALAISGMGFCGRVAGKEWLNLLQPIWWLSSGVIIAFGIAAIVALYLRHSRAALLIVAASTIPLSYNLLDARARYDWQKTMKDLAKKVELGYMPGNRVFIGEKLETVSSFLFYSPHGVQVSPLAPNQPVVGDFILVERSKSSDWPQAEKIGNNRSHVLLQIPKK